MHPVRGQMALLEGEEPAPGMPVMAGGFHIAPRVGGPALLGSTVEAVGFDRSTTEQGIGAVLEGVARFMPATRRWRIAGSWAGLRPRSADAYPVVGPATRHRNLWVATGHFRSGILWAPLTATWIAEGILTGMLPAEAGPFGMRRFVR
jgi:glycine/D-amino acid oxidase-like deaminating enzyme